MNKFAVAIAAFILGVGIFIPLQIHAEPSIPQRNCLGSYEDFIYNAQGNHSLDILDGYTELSDCQQNDILKLNDELEALRDDMKENAETCIASGDLESRYLKTMMEMYFVRHVLDSSSGVYGPEDIEILEEDRSEILALLREEMREIFVQELSHTTSETFELYFAEWSEEYEDRILDYADCDEGNWAELEDSWTGLVETLGSIGNSMKGNKQKEPEKVEAGNETADNQSQQNVLSAYEFAQKEAELLEAEIEPPLSIGEAAAEYRTIEGVLNALEVDELRVDLEKDKAEREGRYAILYGENAAVPTNNIQEMVDQLNIELEEAYSTHFPAIVEGLEEVTELQCS